MPESQRLRIPDVVVVLCAAATAFVMHADTAFAADPLILRHRHFLFTLDPDRYPSWQTLREEWRYRGQPFVAPAYLLVDGDVLPELPAGVTRTRVPAWDPSAIRQTVAQQVAPLLAREPGSVMIRRSATGAVTFEGVGLPGRQVDVDATVTLIIAALERGVTDIVLPVEEPQPLVQVDDSQLRAEGIRAVVAVGESNFAGSPPARRHNIAVGMSRFNGHMIPRGSVFSFNEVLGPVNASTGYRKELVILGERTLPDYGGGLCQVSTTAYRGVWEAGFPIQQRRNHSFAVRYYAPQGTDATIYPPVTDMRFVNDSRGALLLQTHVEGDQAYFIYYGTPMERSTVLAGPFTWGENAPPPDRSEYTTEIPAGTTRKVGERVPGISAAWFRSIRSATGALLTEGFYSVYEARPLFLQMGVEPGSPLLQPAVVESSEGASASSTGVSSAAASSATATRPTRRRD